MNNKRALLILAIILIIIMCISFCGESKSEEMQTDQAVSYEDMEVNKDGTEINAKMEEDLDVESTFIDERNDQDESRTPTGVIIGNDQNYLSNPDDLPIVNGGIEFDD